MKKTELKDVYCVPLSADWTEEMEKMRNPFNGTNVCGVGIFKRKDRTEIPVQQFIDLLEDRIVPWRLEEIGFKLDHLGDILELHVNGWALSVDNDSSIWLTHGDSGTIINISTFTELLQLLKFLNYEVK